MQVLTNPDGTKRYVFTAAEEAAFAADERVREAAGILSPEALARQARREKADGVLRARFAQPLGPPVPASASRPAPDLRTHRELLASIRRLVHVLNRPVTRTSSLALPKGRATLTVHETR